MKNFLLRTCNLVYENDYAPHIHAFFRLIASLAKDVPHLHERVIVALLYERLWPLSRVELPAMLAGRVAAFLYT
jgi:hypothetical protein